MTRSNVVAHPAGAASVALANEANPQTVADQQQQIRDLTSQLAIANARLRKQERRADLKAALIGWLLMNSESLVFDIVCDADGPVFVHDLVEGFYADRDARAAARLGKLIVGMVDADVMPRLLCEGCGETECQGCRGCTTEIELPREITNLLTENGVRRG